MTTVNSQRPISTANASAPMSPTVGEPAHEDGIESLPSPGPAAATFESAKPRVAPFGPPSSPKLIDERTATSSSDRERVRDENHERINNYNEQYRAYLQTYTAAVESAPNLERVLHFGEPVSYQPTANLPVSQRARYGELEKPALANQVVAHAAIGERVLKESGVKLPGAYAFADVKATVFGNGVKSRVIFDDDGLHTKNAVQLGLNSKAIEPKLNAFGQTVGVGVTLNIDPETGKVKTALQARAGGFGLELDEAGKMTAEGGVSVGEYGSAKGGSSYDGKNRRAEMFVKGNLKFGELELEAKGGIGVQFLTTEFVEKVVDPDAKGFFDADKIKALRTVGR